MFGSVFAERFNTRNRHTLGEVDHDAEIAHVLLGERSERRLGAFVQAVGQYKLDGLPNLVSTLGESVGKRSVRVSPMVVVYVQPPVEKTGERLIVASVQKSIDEGRVTEETGPYASRNVLQTTTLLDGLTEHNFNASFGGARRDEEKARAKERIFSFRDEFGQWDPKNQRPELWNLYNGKHSKGQHIRVFPISNWTEMDVWQYVLREKLELPSIYYSHEREVLEREGVLLPACDYITLLPGEKIEKRIVRCRTVGDMTCAGMVESKADNVADIIQEVAAARVTERGGRADDKRSEAAMEDRKVQGYF